MFAIRLDDITPDMNWTKFNMARAIFDQYGIKPLIGVVPDNHDVTLTCEEARDDFWECMRTLQMQGWTIAQHGYQHCYETTKSGILGINPFSEFAGLPYKVQLEKLQKGKEILQIKGIHVRIFMAPGHTYDRNTLRALRECGFEAVTDGYTSLPYEYKGLRFFPSRISRPIITSGMDTLCLHTNHMSEQDFEELTSFIQKNRESIMDYSEFLNMDVIKRRNVLVLMEERKNLKLKKIKNYVGSNSTIQEFFLKTNHENKWIKNWKRLVGFPVLFIKLTILRRK